MKKGAGKMFMSGFLKSFLFFVLFIGISTLSYRLVMHFFDIKDITTDIEVVTEPVLKQQVSITEAKIDDVSKHLIYCVDEKDGSIKKIILEIFNCEARKIYYITIPIKTQFTLSSSLHKELVLIKPSIPQFLKLSAITGYFPKETVYEYGVLMIEDLLDIEISYYSVVPQSLYETVFTTENINQNVNSTESSENLYPREVFSDNFLEYLQTIKTESDLRSYIEEIYTQIESNLKLSDKLMYMDCYITTPGKNIFFEVISGKESNSSYIIDKYEVEKQLKACMTKD